MVCINPPFTEAYLADVMARLAELKLRFRLRRRKRGRKRATGRAQAVLFGPVLQVRDVLSERVHMSELTWRCELGPEMFELG